MRKGTGRLRTRLIWAATAATAALVVYVATAVAASPPSWSGPASTGASGLVAVSCASTSSCVGVAAGGDVIASSSPLSSAWNATSTNLSDGPTSISCPGGSYCVVGEGGGEIASAPQSALGSWSATGNIDSSHTIEGVSCPSTGLCVAVDDDGGVLYSASPTGGQSAWTRQSIDGTTALNGVSCPTTSFCAAVDEDGHVLTTSNPDGGTWTPTQVADLALTGISCNAAPLCAAIDGSGDVYASANAKASPVTWSETYAADPNTPHAISCIDGGLCVLVDGSGDADTSDAVTTSSPGWSSASIDAGHALTSVACIDAGMCVAVDSSGDAVTGTVSAPSPTTGTGSASSQTAATLNGTVDPGDAALTGCQFDYGTTTAYGASVPCSSTPAAGGGAQSVSAQIGSLSAGTTYHFALVAASAVGSASGKDASFVTPAPIKANPSLSGTSAVGSTLTCNPGVSVSGSTTLAYQWLSNTTAIAGATAATYTVPSIEAGDHLSCEVTVSGDGATTTATSGFDSIPAQSGAALVESSVGKPKDSRTTISVPVTCSPQATGSCTFTLTLTASKTVKHKTTQIKLGSSSAKVGSGARKTLSVGLSASGRRFVARHGRTTVTLTVKGTVLGRLTATLATDRLALTAKAAGDPDKPAKKAEHSAKPAHRKKTVRRNAWRAAIRSAAATKPATAATGTVLAATPYMGWDTYLAGLSTAGEATILEEASLLKSTGLEADGYKLVWLDAGWWQGQRAANGQIEVSSAEWPHGIAWLAATLHANGFELGVYSDAGATGCGINGGLLGHYQQDINTLAAWGVDAIKVDWCGGAAAGLTPSVQYGEIHQAILENSSHRPMILDICNFLQPGQGSTDPGFAVSAFYSYTFGPSDGQSWRTDTDIGAPDSVLFSSVLRNLDADATQPLAAGPGHWNDPDYLGPGMGMNAAQFQTQFSMWAMLAAPLMVSADLRSISKTSLDTLTNKQVIAVDQDPAGIQGWQVPGSVVGNASAWEKPLTGGGYAVALLNTGSVAQTVSTSTSAIGMAAASSYSVQNLWTSGHSTTTGALTATVAPYSTVLLKVTAA